jgi:HlyD family secretion protein
MGIRRGAGRDVSGRHFWRGRRAIWLLAGGIAVVAAAGSAGVYQLTSGAQHTSAAPATARVQRGTVTSAVAAAGALQPAQSRGLAFSINGTVTEVRVRPGDQVTAGEVLARIDDTDAKAKVSTAQSALSTAETTLTTAQTAASASSSPSSSSGGACLAAAAGTSGALGTVVSVVTTQSTSPSASPSASTSPSPSPRRSTSPSSSASRRPGGQTSASSRGGSGCSSSRAGGTGTGGTNGGGNSGGSSTDPVLRAQQAVNNAQLSLQQAQAQLAGTTITAPIAGKVLSVAGAVGSQATSGGTGFIVLGDVAEMQVKASFPEADAIRLKVGLTATVSLADRPGEQIPAKVTQVDPVGTTSGQMVTYGVLLAFDKVPDNLLNGQSANVQVQTGSAINVMFVPSSAVHGVANGSGTAEVQTGKTVEQRQVQVGLLGDQYTEIKSGLTEGEEVRTSW